MDAILSVMGQNLLSPIILSFALGLAAALARSSLSVPEAAAKALSIYLLFAIGFKGGASVAAHGLDARLALALVAGIGLSFAIPVVAFTLLRSLTRMSRVDAAAVAGHYGSISIVTFVSATAILTSRAIDYEGYMVAVAAAMEAPAIVAALWLAARGGSGVKMDAELWREVLLNGSIVLLIGAFLIGAVTGERGLAEIESFIVSPFKGVLCLFLLDMGLVAGRGLKQSRGLLSAGALAFAGLMPLIGAAMALPVALMLDFSAGGTALMMTLAASASYIAVPAAMRVALPEANPSIYLTLSLGVTFPFNLALGIPLYVAIAGLVTGG
ncbi:sodium-dependent bicarbonate transport family permease [Defluviimonas sp. D31]|uniref:sodium-dependent bicarbonate transport family permease n=1 Tax=Defluviimonas sp. D31 TaxID=3083253 RepID=UPI00296FE5E9|nr:sodium-dependent bicarbonate transport family permease [Defluviimonas sp. D31]MDW4549681.1 sodium-dependent bicarbonate transport family permease [Defluviimonas sp. D31]